MVAVSVPDPVPPAGMAETAKLLKVSARDWGLRWGTVPRWSSGQLVVSEWGPGETYGRSGEGRGTLLLLLRLFSDARVIIGLAAARAATLDNEQQG